MCARLNCDPALPLQIHLIKKLVLPLALLDRARALKQPVRQRRLAVIDVRDDAKIARQLNGHGSRHYPSATVAGQSWVIRYVCALRFARKCSH